MKLMIYGIYGLPPSYHGITYGDTQLVSVKQEQLREKVSNAPNSGTLTVQGTAAPIVNQLLKTRKVRGIDFVERSTSAFDQHTNPHAEVVVLYGVGSEVSMNGKVSGLVLRNLVEYYRNRKTLLVIETHLSKQELLSRYDFKVTNFMKILRKEEEIWA